MDDQIRELVSITKAITEGFDTVAQEINDNTRATKEQTNALLELSEVVTLFWEEYRRNSGDKHDTSSAEDGRRSKKGKKRKGD